VNSTSSSAEKNAEKEEYEGKQKALEAIPIVLPILPYISGGTGSGFT
jgi:hypothetical protein